MFKQNKVLNLKQLGKSMDNVLYKKNHYKYAQHLQEAIIIIRNVNMVTNIRSLS